VTTVTIVYEGPNERADVLRLLGRLLHAGAAETATVREIRSSRGRPTDDDQQRAERARRVGP
jgi:hypothetical protein